MTTMIDATKTAQPRKRTSLDRACERKRNLSSIVTSIWFQAYRHGESHKWILDQISVRVHGHRDWAKLPQWAKSAIGEVSMTMLQAAQGWMLSNVWIYEGIAYANKWDALPEHVRELIRKDELKLTTVWAEYSQRFVDRKESDVRVF